VVGKIADEDRFETVELVLRNFQPNFDSVMMVEDLDYIHQFLHTFELVLGQLELQEFAVPRIEAMKELLVEVEEAGVIVGRQLALELKKPVAEPFVEKQSASAAEDRLPFQA
jgi:hypothetical protein